MQRPGILLLVLFVSAQLCLPLFSQDVDPAALYPVLKNGKWGYANRSGTVVIKPQFESANNFVDGVAEVLPKNTTNFAWIDRNGNILPSKPVPSDSRPDDLVAVKRADKYGFVNPQGNLVIPATFDGAADFSEGLGAVKVADEWGYIDAQQRMVITPRFLDADRFREGLASVAIYKDPLRQIPESCGYISPNGNFVIKPQFDSCRSFSQGLAAVRIGKKWGYVDRSGRIAIAPQFDNVLEFTDGLALVFVGRMVADIPHGGSTSMRLRTIGKWGYVDTTGKFVSETMTWRTK